MYQCAVSIYTDFGLESSANMIPYDSTQWRDPHGGKVCHRQLTRNILVMIPLPCKAVQYGVHGGESWESYIRK